VIVLDVFADGPLERSLAEQDHAAKVLLLDRANEPLSLTLAGDGTGTPDTILRWHRQLIRKKWTYEAKGVGRPGLMKEIRELIVRFAKENTGWGYCRIEGALRNVGHRVSPSTIRNVLKQHGIKPAPDRPTSWRAFLRSHWDQIAGTDFFTTEVWTASGLATYYVLFIIELDTRRAHLVGITRSPNDTWMGHASERAAEFLKGRRVRSFLHSPQASDRGRFRCRPNTCTLRPRSSVHSDDEPRVGALLLSLGRFTHQRSRGRLCSDAVSAVETVRLRPVST
jgi:hypothetical protein